MFTKCNHVAERDELIEEATYSGLILPTAEWYTLNFVGNVARITYRVRVHCAVNYYNSTCTKLCRPRNDQFGHYNCDRNGDKECIPGWKGDNCDIGESSTLISRNVFSCLRVAANGRVQG